MATRTQAQAATLTIGIGCAAISSVNANRPPTADEIKLVEKLLAPRECYVNYAPNAIF